MKEIKKSYCRLCQAFCGYEVTVEDGVITRLRGDPGDPQSQGYCCFKGLRTVEHYHSPQRVRHALVRRGDTLQPEPSAYVLDKAGRQLAGIIREHGPESVGFFLGTQALFNTLVPPMVHSFASSLGTPRVFTTMTIDQSAKWIAEGRMGTWHAGQQDFESADVWLLVGSNPVVTKVMAGGPRQFVFPNPRKTAERMKQRGMKLIVVDPRVSETAEIADLHLRPLPGRDAELAAALLHIIFREGWHDETFCAQYVEGFQDLRSAVQPFAPDACADYIGVSVDDIEQAAAMFASAGKRGMAGTGTGVNMARFSNLAEHLWQAINVVCGRFPREGETIKNAGVLQPLIKPRAEVVCSGREWESGASSIVHRLGQIRGGMMSAEICNEILADSPRKMRALICIGGNLQVALPDQARAEKALQHLDLLLVVDPYMTGTARLADYVIGPTMHFERADHTMSMERLFNDSFAHYSPALVSPPQDADVVDDYQVIWSLAQSTGVPLSLGGQVLSGEELPDAESLLELLASKSRVPLEEVRATDGGALYGAGGALVEPPRGQSRFLLMAADVQQEMAQLIREFKADDGSEWPQSGQLLLIVRRQLDLMNSSGSLLPITRTRVPANYAFINPLDMQRLGLADEQRVTLRRAEKRFSARIKMEENVRSGTLSISHGWSGDDAAPWAATNVLVDPGEGAQDINRMPVMTGFAVDVLPDPS